MANEPETKTTETENVTVESTDATTVAKSEDVKEIKSVTGHIYNVVRSRGVGRYKQRRTTFRLREMKGVQFSSWGRSSFTRRDVPQDTLVVVKYRESEILGHRYYNAVEPPEIVGEAEPTPTIIPTEVASPRIATHISSSSLFADPEIWGLFLQTTGEYIEFTKVATRLLKLSKQFVKALRKEVIRHG